MVEITAPSLPLMDLGGDPRIVDGNADDLATVDMGVDEFPTLAVPSPLSVCAPDADSDGVADPSDPNDDNDLLTDVVESACGSNPLNGDVVPERIDTPGDDDRDSLVNEALPAGVHAYDCDGDGFVGVVEASVTTSDQDPCGGNGWASDLVSSGGSANRLDPQDLASFVVPVRRLGTYPGHPDYNPRWDLVPQGVAGPGINVQDMAALLAGASGSPPTLAGQRAFGQTCPWPP